MDEQRKHVLTRISKSKKGVRVKESDHNVVIAEFECNPIDDKDNKKVEVYNLKNKLCQAKFKKFTSNTKMLSSSIDDKGDIDQVINRFIKKLNGCIATNFDKRRINKDKDNKEDDLYSRMRLLKNNMMTKVLLNLMKLSKP